MLSICISVSRRKANNLRQSSKEATVQTRLNEHEPSQGISGQVFSSLRAPETACPTWSQQMTAQRPGKVYLHFGQLPKCRWVVWYPVTRTPAHHCPSPAFLPDAMNLSAFPSAVEKQIFCARAARKPPRRQGWTNTTLLKVSLVRCSQAYGHQRLHARPEASKWQHSFPGKSICILASSQNADESSGIE